MVRKVLVSRFRNLYFRGNSVHIFLENKVEVKGFLLKSHLLFLMTFALLVQIRVPLSLSRKTLENLNEIKISV